MDLRDIENLAELAKLDLNEEEKKNLAKDLGSILDYVKQIGNLKLDLDIKKKNYYLQNVFRDDKICPREFSHEQIISQFSGAEGGFVKVKKIL